MPAHMIGDRPMTGAERARASRARRQARSVMLSGQTLQQLAAIGRRDGDASLVATIERLTQESVATHSG